MARQHRIWITALLVLAIALIWWFGRDAKTEATAAQTAAASDTRAQQLGAGSRARPTGARLDLVSAPKAAISGTIRDLEGLPIQGAQVCAISSVSERRGLEDRKPHCVRSGSDGRYRIESLLPIKTAVHASAPSFKPNRWERRDRGETQTFVTLHAGHTIDEIDIVLVPGGVLIRGVVKDIAGGEIEGAQVRVSGGVGRNDRGQAIGRSGSDGAFELWSSPGLISVAAEADGYAMGNISAVAPGEFIELFLTPEAVLTGKVVHAVSGEPVEGAVVTVQAFLGGSRSARTDDSGRFRVDQLQPGAYKPTAKTDELYGQAAEKVHLGLGQTFEGLVIPVHPAVFVEGTVMVAELEQPCTSGSVRLDEKGINSEWASIDEQGRVEFRGLLAGEYQVNVNCPGHISQDSYDKLIIGTESIGGLIWEVHEGLAIRGEVIDEAGQSVPDINVRAQPVVDADAARSQVTNAGRRSESDGSFELAGLLPGRYEITVSGWRARPGPSEPITVELDGADVHDVRIVMPAVGSIRGRVIDETGKPISGASVDASLIDSPGGGRSRTNDAGEFTIAELRPGQTRVTASASKMWWGGTGLRKPGTSDDDLQGELVEVLANETVEVVLIVEAHDGRITGVVVDEGGGPVADAFIDIERMSDKAGANAAGARAGVRWSFGAKPVLTDADGRFEVGELPDGKFMVRAHRKGGGEAVLEDVPLGSHVQLTITSTAELAGTVRLDGGGTLERFTVTIEDKVAGIWISDSFFRTDAWRLREIPPGKFEIVASAVQGSVTLDAPIELREGEIRKGIELVLQPRLTLRGRIIDLETREPVAGLEVFAAGQGSMGSDDGERRNVTGSDGRFEITDAPIGKIHLFAWNRAAGSNAKYDQLWQPLTLAAEPLTQELGDIEIVARRLEPKQKPGDLGFALNDWDPTIEPGDWEPIVAVVRPGGPAAQVGLAAGDVIEQVNGHDVRGSNSSRYSALTQVPEGTVVKLSVRGDKTVEITAGPPIR